MILKNLLKQNNIDSSKLKYKESGKPYLENSPLYISISDDGGLMAIAIDEEPIGIDIQFFKDINDGFKKFIHYDYLMNKDAITNFSIKEAIIKLEDKKLKDINDINIEEYSITSYGNNLYTLNIAKYKN